MINFSAFLLSDFQIFFDVFELLFGVNGADVGVFIERIADAQGLQAVARGTDDYQGLEAWQRGDSLRRVDWKAWSRGQGLWVKQFSDLLGSETLLDYSQLQGDTEQRLSVLCFHVLRLDNALQPYSLQLPGQAVLGPDIGPAHRDSCLSALALFGREAP